VPSLRRSKEPKEPLGPYGRVGKSIAELDERLGIAKGGRTFLDKIFPDHWSFMLGEIALYSFVVLLATGVFLCLYYIPSVAPTVYHGPYKPLDGQIVSEAYASTVNLSFSVRAGLLMRQMHHWACDIFVGSIVLHMARVFFTGAFRKPRELNWTIGLTMLILAILNGFIGYSLPDDLISGTGIRIAYSILLSIPFVGSYLAFFLFGGNFPGTAIIPRFFTLHVLILPAVIVGLLSAHLFLLVRQKHTQFPGHGKTEHNVVGSPMYPVFMAKTTGYLFMISGVTALLGALFQINPIWQFGSYKASNISYAVQPDWYMGWLDGALRVMPAWEFVGFGHTIPFEVFFPAIIFPGIVFTICYLWPMIERRITKDTLPHNLLDRPRDRPKRTAAGAAMLGLLSIMFIASATDVIANFFHISLNTILILMRVLVIVTPLVCYFVTWKICLELQATPRGGQRKVANVVTLTAAGEYVATPMPPPPGTDEDELAPERVPALLELDGASVDDGSHGPPEDDEAVFGTSSVRTVPR
jgi:quinol---cytochrome-c reductase cytochrome b subunit